MVGPEENLGYHKERVRPYRAVEADCHVSLSNSASEAYLDYELGIANKYPFCEFEKEGLHL